jgi:hypothetical protein
MLILDYLKKRKVHQEQLAFIFMFFTLITCDSCRSDNDNKRQSLTAEDSSRLTGLQETDFQCLVAYPQQVEHWLDQGGNTYFVFYTPRERDKITLKAYKRRDFGGPSMTLDYSPDTSCTLESHPTGRYTLGNLQVDSAELRTLHEENPAGKYLYLLFIPRIMHGDQVSYTILRREKRPTGDTAAVEKIYLYDPIQANPSPPKEPN